MDEPHGIAIRIENRMPASEELDAELGRIGARSPGDLRAGLVAKLGGKSTSQATVAIDIAQRAMSPNTI
jgi:hypothetical protein